MVNSRYVRRLLGLFVLLGVSALLLVVFRYFSRSSQHQKHVAAPAASVDLALKSLHFTESVSGRKAWELYASHGDYSRAADLSTLKDIRFVVLRSGKAGPVTVTAKRGEYLHSTRVVTLMEDVVARGEDGLSFDTSRISYDTDGRIFRTSAPVRFADGRLAVEGVGMELDTVTQKVRIQRQVVATIYPGKNDK